MSTTALGIAPDSDGNGVTPLTHRKVQQYQWASPGVVGGLEVSGGTDLNYTVSEGMAVTTRGDSDGYSLSYFEGGTIETTAGNSSYPRYDVLWLSAHDISQGDDDNLVTLGVTQGTAASNPSVPSVDSDCTIIDTLLVPAGMTATSSCTSTGDIDYAVPYGASLGLLGSVVITANGNWPSGGNDSSYHGIAGCSISVPTDRHIGIKVTITGGAVNGTYDDGEGSVYVRLLDGSDVIETRELRLVAKGNAVSQFYEVFTEVSKGTHAIYMNWNLNAMDYVYLYYASTGWAGQRLDIVDYGVAE